MNDIFVYLCGPMTENTPEQADGWRQEATKQLTAAGFKVSSPMREKGMLTKEERMGMTYDKYGDVPELRATAILARDQFDVRHASIVLANMTELGRSFRTQCQGTTHVTSPENIVQIPSIGSDWEMQLAYELRTPVVLIAPSGNPYAEHPFLRGASNIIRFDTMQPGINWIVRNLGLYV